MIRRNSTRRQTVQSQAWKDLEREVARELKGARVTRGSDFSKSDVDVAIADFPHLKVDAKHRSSPWKHHSHLRIARGKYCAAPGEVAVLVTKTKGEHGAVVSMSLHDFAVLLDTIRAARNIRGGNQ